ncbi:TetR/AcrR family transcriptional regulator [Vineibacter terrae]|uniref:TetR/AcrR family transcriptional regulator n=1 Tax=Vineibacter terrae TaxID=2586908 RepID=A0A5C8PDK6_9HYPH|nr:TetR/AcrR family transcriptional regulator [Vineibacter terrae]TXL71886.1 TetR/AcrR family transcriptional regulator [Vineibacter terrae]
MTTLSTDAVKRPRRKRRTREERARENWDALINAAAEIVGTDGYQGANIAQVTSRAGLALGTFYQYFESRQDLFDKLLPEVGGRLLGALGQEIQGASTAVEVEERGTKAYFEYAKANPSTLRVFTEAQVFAPAAYEQHMANVLSHYAASLRGSKGQGDFANFSARELEVLALILIAARTLLYQHYSRQGDVPAWVLRTYMKIIRALAGMPAS